VPTPSDSARKGPLRRKPLRRKINSLSKLCQFLCARQRNSQKPCCLLNRRSRRCNSYRSAHDQSSHLILPRPRASTQGQVVAVPAAGLVLPTRPQTEDIPGAGPLQEQPSAGSFQLSALSHQTRQRRPLVPAAHTSRDSRSQSINGSITVGGGGLRADRSAHSHLSLKTIPALGTTL
jgi:hypothetical protein